MKFIDFINGFRKTVPFKILGIVSFILVPIMAGISTQSLAHYSNGFGAIGTALLQTLWIYILFPALFIILFVIFIVLNIIAIVSKKKINFNVAKNNVIADVGYIFCLFYLIYCFIFYIVIVPTSVSSVEKFISYVNDESKNFSGLSGENKENLCVASRVNTLKCFVNNIHYGYIDKKYEGDAILTFDRIYYFNSFYKNDESLNKSLLLNTTVFVSDRLKIIAPVQITRIFNDYFYTKDLNKKIKLRKGY